MGLDPQSYPVAAFFGAFGLWMTNLWLVTDELKALAAKRDAKESEARSQKPEEKKEKP
jgi:hypothetical protein